MGKPKFLKKMIKAIRNPGCLSRKATAVIHSVKEVNKYFVDLNSVQPAASSSCSAKPPVYPMLQPITGTIAQHQVDTKYAGNQCTTLALMALAFHSFKRVSTWTADDLDNILVVGSRFHVLFRDKLRLSENTDGRISLDEIPKKKYLPFSIPEAEDVFFAKRCMALTGLVTLNGDGLCDMDIQKYPPLSIAILKILVKGMLCAVTIGEFTVAIAQDDNKFWVLDSHARDQHGHMDANGTAIALPFTSIEELVCYLSRTYGSRQQYDAVGLQFLTEEQLDDEVDILY